MLKRVNKYLLENCPLIWNTKIVWMLVILLVVNLGFYIAGFFSFFDLKELQEYDLFERYFDNGAVWIGVLLSILVFILWLNKYFKQNAFKSFYPKRNASLFAEFVIIFVVCFLNISFYIPYTEGFRQRISNSISTQQLEYEVDIVNKGAAFTLQNNYYSSYYIPDNRCIPIPVFDSLVSEEEVLKLWVENEVEYVAKLRNEENIHSSYYKKWKNVNPEDYLLYKDSLPQPYYTNSEYIILLKKHFPERKSKFDIDKENEIDVGKEAEKDSRTNINSIYNYCSQPILFESNKEDDTLINIGQNEYLVGRNKKSEPYALYVADLLQNNKKEEIEKLLNDYLAIADKYEVSYRFKDKKWIDYIYNPPYYFVDYNLNDEYIYDNYDKKKPVDHILAHSLALCMEYLIDAQSNVINMGYVLVLLCLALFFAILIFAFRITTLRVWLMSFAGAIVVMFIYIAVYFLSSKLLGLKGYSDEIWMISQCFAFILLFWAFTIFCISKKKMKKFSGMTLNWGIVTFPLIFPLILRLYIISLDKIKDGLLREYPQQRWINNHSVEIGLLIILLFFVFLFLITPVVKKWKSLPEE